jgi:hypothetical protein
MPSLTVSQWKIYQAAKQCQAACVSVVQWVESGQLRNALTQPINVAADGFVNYEFEMTDDGCLKARLVSGGLIHIPFDAITNVFDLWWLFSSNNGGQGWNSWWFDQDAMDDYVDRAQDRSDAWDKDGTLKGFRGQRTDEPQSGRKVRGRLKSTDD